MGRRGYGAMTIERKPGKRKRRVPYTRAGAVKVTRADGTTEILPSYTPAKLRSINRRRKRK